ncbi:hypothetical protein K491DRAFT_716808 [Lophiostoma macrostomum CBS 122681]|uniref:Rhodopsin domain-containing protein n=1 Tax=Lophiostoma macrostomum CBS 122681 TaxID=1314788 RepID=A0A6A6T799_9PLEO|nr:hypothetical protein K491DRAFT_716808 [Lophiostoma macrostomum CBS 122681]
MLDGVVELLEKRRTPPIADKGMIVSVVSWIMFIIMLCVLLTRMALKLALSKKGAVFGCDDTFIVAAALFSLGQTIAVSFEAQQVLGQHVYQLNASQLTLFAKAEYVGCMLYLANMGCARISVCFLVKKILPGERATRLMWFITIFSMLWTLSGVLVTAFPCKLPHPWNFNGSCINLKSWINYVGASNIVIEIIVVSVPLFVWNLRLSAGRKVSISLVFLSRLFIVPVITTQLAFFNHYKRSPDFSYDYWRNVLCVQIAQNLSVITACIPTLHPFVLHLLAGITKPESLQFKGNPWPKIKSYVHRTPKKNKFDSMSSQSSTLPMQEENDYCKPLATYGFDRSSADLRPQLHNRIPSNVATPIFGLDPPENVFMRSVQFPLDCPGAPPAPKRPRPPPQTASQCGILPIIDWESESDCDSIPSSPTRKRDSDYVFNREKVISVPEANAMYSQEYWKQYPPPPLSGER